MPRLCETDLTRRAVLGAAGVLFAWNFLLRTSSAAGARDPRLVCIVLRGALDGLSAVAPIGDPDYASLREGIALAKEGPNAALPLDGLFALHPAMPNFARLYRAGQASVIHAVATGYRERSHFDGQDVLESGQPAPGCVESGWLNRLLMALPKGERIGRAGVLAVGTTPPLIVRGPAPVMGWAPPLLPRASDDLARRLLDLYGQRDPVLAEALAHGLDTERMVKAPAMGAPMMLKGVSDPAAMSQIAEGAARLIATDEGPRVAALAFSGWDTHANEGGANGRLAHLLGGLDGALAALENGLKACWKDTAILIMTEFGRTARLNGTDGTDHGTGTVAFLVGGAIRGGRVIADWPGLKPAQLLDGRDLKPTTDLRAVAKGILADLYPVSAATLGREVFPQTEELAPMRGFI